MNLGSVICAIKKILLRFNTTLAHFQTNSMLKYRRLLKAFQKVRPLKLSIYALTTQWLMKSDLVIELK